MSDNPWNQHALNWACMGPPLRPHATDLQNYQKAMNRLWGSLGNPRLTAMLLGVTPELVGLNWPEQTRLLALDHNIQMIKNVGSKNEKIIHQVVCADWGQSPVLNASAQLILGDGCFTFFNFLDGDQNLISKLKKNLVKKGYLLVRFFIQAPIKESTQDVFAAVFAGAIKSFHSFKWRLAMSLQEHEEKGVKLSDVYDVWHSNKKNVSQLSQQPDWKVSEINTINAYKASTVNYYFPKLTSLRNQMQCEFEELDCFYGDYELSERCPIMLYRSRY